MPTTFQEDWKKAKTDFTTATKAKKPTASFLGIFDKGAGISSALKSADTAKNAGELFTAMKAFKTASDDYAKTLDKAIADPKITDAAAKPAYIAAATKLKAELQDIYKRAGLVTENILGAKKKDAVNPAQMKEDADYEAVKAKLVEYRDVRTSYKMNRSQFGATISVITDAFGERVAALQAAGQSGDGKLVDYLKDPEAKKYYNEAAGRYDTFNKAYAAYIVSYDAAVKIRERLADRFKPELNDLTEDKLLAPYKFETLIQKELDKKPAARANKAGGDAFVEAGVRLNVRYLAVKGKEISDLYDLVFSHSTAAIKARQVGNAAKATSSLAEAQKSLDKIEILVKQIQSDYATKKGAISSSADGKDILVKINYITILHKKALDAIAGAKK